MACPVSGWILCKLCISRNPLSTHCNCGLHLSRNLHIHRHIRWVFLCSPPTSYFLLPRPASELPVAWPLTSHYLPHEPPALRNWPLSQSFAPPTAAHPWSLPVVTPSPRQRQLVPPKPPPGAVRAAFSQCRFPPC